MAVKNSKSTKRYDNDPYSKLSTLELARLIVDNADRGALEAITDKRKPIFYKEQWLSVSGVIVELAGSKLRYKYLKGKKERIEDLTSQAILLLFARFANIPERSGPDCRNQYRELISQVNRAAEEIDDVKKLEIETIAADRLSRLIVKHFIHCLQEVNRAAPELFKRYSWKTESGNINLYRPAWISAADFRKWLEEEFDKEEPDLHKRRREIQQRIYKRFGRGGFESLETVAIDKSHQGGANQKRNILAELVADKKKEEIESLRPAISSLGPKQLGLMVKSIFTDIEQGCYNDSKIAYEFGLSKATLSRFAGSRWKRNEDSAVPDLWKNVAIVAAENARFTEAIANQNVASAIERILEMGDTDRKEP